MTIRPAALDVDAIDPALLGRFWAGVLRRKLVEGGAGTTLVPDDPTGLAIRFRPTREPKVGPNQVHLDLTSTTLEDQQDTVVRALALGGRHLDVGQLPEEEHVVLADPEGNEFCVVEPGNRFLAGCGLVGALSCDGTQAVGYF